MSTDACFSLQSTLFFDRLVCAKKFSLMSPQRENFGITEMFDQLENMINLAYSLMKFGFEWNAICEIFSYPFLCPVFGHKNSRRFEGQSFIG